MLLLLETFKLGDVDPYMVTHGQEVYIYIYIYI